MRPPHFILEINTRVWLRELGSGTPLSLTDVPDTVITGWAQQGYDAVWLMGVWQTSEKSREIARAHEGLRHDYSMALPDWQDEDVGGSPYAICGYQVSAELGGDAALLDFRLRLRLSGIKLILDFISNHTALDHPWVKEHPEWYIRGTEGEVAADPSRWFWVQAEGGPMALAHGRDPYFPAWTDTAQLDYHHNGLQAQMRAELASLAARCDGVRCDMAMLDIATIFERVWGRQMAEFWPQAIAEARAVNPDFCFIAEVYWGLEDTLVEMGFDATYDKGLLDQVTARHALRREQFAVPERDHRRRVRFLENHDETRIAARLDVAPHMAYAAWIFALPSVRLIHDGQTSGKTVRLPVQLLRASHESIQQEIHTGYHALLDALAREAVRRGQWLILSPQQAWSGNESHQSILGQGYDLDSEHLRIFVNLSGHQAQCWVRLELGNIADRQVMLRDCVGSKSYARDGFELMLRGLYLDLEPWEVHVFDCQVNAAADPQGEIWTVPPAHPVQR